MARVLKETIKGFCNYQKKTEYIDICEVFGKLQLFSIDYYTRFYLCSSCFTRAEKLEVKKTPEKLKEAYLKNIRKVPEQRKFFEIKSDSTKEILIKKESENMNTNKKYPELIAYLEKNSKDFTIKELYEIAKKDFNYTASEDAFWMLLSKNKIEYKKIRQNKSDKVPSTTPKPPRKELPEVIKPVQEIPAESSEIKPVNVNKEIAEKLPVTIYTDRKAETRNKLKDLMNDIKNLYLNDKSKLELKFCLKHFDSILQGNAEYILQNNFFQI